jgi:ABC-type transport system involved in multi-copper enzyme maturation permease subunit
VVAFFLIVLRRRVDVFLVVLGAAFFGALSFVFFGVIVTALASMVSETAGGGTVVALGRIIGVVGGEVGSGASLTGSGALRTVSSTGAVVVSVFLLFNILIRGCWLCFLANFLVADSILLFFPIWNSYVFSSTVNSNRGCKNLKKLRAVFLGGSTFSRKAPQSKKERGDNLMHSKKFIN